MSTRQAPPSAAELLAHADFLRRLARRLVGDEHGAEDVVQQALLAAVESPGGRRGPLRGWLTGVVKNLSRMANRTRGRRHRREMRAARPERTESAAEVAARMEVSRKLVEAVASLDDPYRTVVVWRYFDDLTTGQIADRLDVPSSTVRTRLRRGLATLRGRLDRDHGSREAWCLALLPFLRGPVEFAANEVRGAVVRGAASTTRTTVGLLIALLVLALIGILLVSESRDEPVPSVDRAERTRPAPERRVDGPGIPGETVSRGGPDVSPMPPDRSIGMPPDDVAEIRVVDADGRPVAQAEVALLLPPTPFLLPRPPIIASEGRTDARGVVRLTVAPFLRHSLRVSHPDYCVAGDVECFGGNVSRFVLPRGGALFGRVADRETGESLPGMTVWAMDFTACGALHEWRTRTDEEGRYRIEGIGPGMLNLRVWSRDRPTTGAETTTRVVSGGETRVDFRVGRGVVRHLRVVDAETGLFAPDVTVICDWQVVARGRGDSLVTTPVPVDPPLGLEVRGKGYLDRHVRQEEFDDRRPQDPLVVRLTRGRLVRGEVLLADGRPAPGVPVGVGFSGQEETSWLAGIWQSGETDDTGRFAVRAAHAGTWMTWEVHLPRGGVHRGPWTPVPDGDDPIDLPRFEIRPTSILRGTVVAPDGRPLERGYVTACPADGSRPVAHGPIDSLGRFRLAGLAAGALRFAVHSVEGWGTQWWRRTVDGDAEVRWRMSIGRTISGRVIRDDGSPCGDTWIQVRTSGGSVRTDADGRFLVRGLDVGPYRVEVATPTGLVSVEDVSGDSHGVEVVVPRRR